MANDTKEGKNVKGNGVLAENEKQANKIVAKVMRVTFLIFALVYILNVIGIFVVDMGIMTFAFVAGSVLLWLPTILVNVLKLEQEWMKYANVMCAVFFTTIMCTTLSYHVVVMYIYGIAIASLYFSKSLNNFQKLAKAYKMGICELVFCCLVL